MQNEQGGIPSHARRISPLPPPRPLRRAHPEPCAAQTFAKDVRISNLSSGAVLARGHAAIERGWGDQPPAGTKAEPSQSVFVEGPVRPNPKP